MHLVDFYYENITIHGSLNVKLIFWVEAFRTGKCLHRLGSAGPKSNQSTQHGVAKSLRQH